MNTVFTSIYDLSADAVEPFFYSLRLSGCSDPVVVFVARISDDCRSLLKKYEATVIDSEYRGLPMAYASLARRIWLTPSAVYRAYWKHWSDRKDPACLIANCWRFFCFRDYFFSLETPPDFVLLSDVRDVVFQSNPFSYPFLSGISVASECTRGTIGQSRANSKWLWEAAGFREMRRLANRTPVCSGTTMADHRTMAKYLEVMTEYLNRRFFWGLFDAIDQGLHNYFIHNRMITPLHLFTNWNGPFLTMDSEIVRPENKNRDGYLCNEDGSVIPVVHQYDRIKNLYRAGETRPPCWEFYR
jgi:hypothetical protein